MRKDAKGVLKREDAKCLLTREDEKGALERARTACVVYIKLKDNHYMAY